MMYWTIFDMEGDGRWGWPDLDAEKNLRNVEVAIGECPCLDVQILKVGTAQLLSNAAIQQLSTELPLPLHWFFINSS